MSNKSNNQGRAFEFIVIDTFFSELSQIRKTKINKNSAYISAKKTWELIDDQTRSNLKNSANAVYKAVIELEPLIIEKSDEYLELSLQVDKKGELGDTRDLVITRNEIYWEVGLSLKHNNFAVKHSRLSKKIDFGQKWFNIPCSSEYWNAVISIFEYLEKIKKDKIKWNFLEGKIDDVYYPLLEAFRKEILNSALIDQNLPNKIVEYLLGKYDFYKVISIDVKKMVQIQTFNLKGQLNKGSVSHKPITIIPVVSMPTRIVSFDFKPKSKTTLELYMDGGWQLSFRIHNASTFVEPSLKFDIQIIGMPTTILTINCLWK